MDLDLMMGLEFKCLKCGKCCHEITEVDNEKSYKRIPIFPEEADRLEALAKEKGVPMKLIEDLVFPDEKNKKILVLTWRFMLDNEENVCPFYNKESGCTIHDQKPLVCQAYPLALKTEDAFNMRIDIDPLCKFTEIHRESLDSLDFAKFKEIYKAELELAKKLLARGKRATMNLTGKEICKEIHIPRNIENDKFSEYLREWDREVLD